MLSCLGIAPTMHPQVVRGRALTPTDSQPVSGAVVLLVDSTGATAARALADERGSFTLRAPTSGTYSLRALRIGFRPSSTEPFVASRSEITMRNVVMNGAAVVLDVRRVVADSRCAAYRDSATAAYRVWEQARTALLSSLIARASNAYEMDIVRVQERFTVRGDSLLSSTEAEQHGSATRPFVAFAAERLAHDGYVTRDAGGVLYAGPDEEILLSDGFAETHCMRVDDSGAEPGTIALAFTPTPERRLPDIAGRLTIDRATGLLRRLDYRYVNLPADETNAGARGTTSFRMLPSGSWLVDRWSISMPVYEQRLAKTFVPGASIRDGSTRMDTRLEVVATQTDGGQVHRIAQGGRVIWTGPQAPFVGRLVDSSGAPVANAAVSVLGTRLTATSDSAGNVRGGATRLGRKRLRIAVPLLDSLALPPVLVDVTVDSATAGWLVRLPTRAQWLARVCAAEKRAKPNTGFLRGTTRTISGGRLASATVVVVWWEVGAGSFLARRLTTVSSSTGDYELCDVPLGSPLNLTVRGTDASFGTLDVRIETWEGFAVKDLRVRAP